MRNDHFWVICRKWKTWMQYYIDGGNIVYDIQDAFQFKTRQIARNELYRADGMGALGFKVKKVVLVH